jgi:secreted trypsin-like serine protease
MMTTIGSVSTFPKISAILYPNPQWDEDSYKHDVALMKLTTPIPEFSEFIMPICVPDIQVENMIVPDLDLKVSGFGDTENRPDGNFSPSSELNSVTVKSISSEMCQDWYQSDFKVLPDQICAGDQNGGRDSCVGDSGGPLVKNFDINGDNVYYQVGVVSFGFECAKPKEPGVYARTASHRLWIYSAMDHFDTFVNNN